MEKKKEMYKCDQCSALLEYLYIENRRYLRMICLNCERLRKEWKPRTDDVYRVFRLYRSESHWCPPCWARGGGI